MGGERRKMDVCLVCTRLRAYWGVTGFLLLLVVFTKFFPLLYLIFLVNLMAMIFTEPFAILIRIYRPLTEEDRQQGMRPADKSELRFIYSLATTFTGIAIILNFLGHQNLSMAVILMCVVIFLLAAAGFCLGRIIYVFLRKALDKKE